MRELSKNQESMHPRLARELKTVNAMIAIYCRDKHRSDKHRDAHADLCDECRQLADYAEKRLAGCPFQQDKPTCGTCTIHCYKPDMKTRIKEVMQYSGPRMILHHPFLAITHLVNEKLIKPPGSKSKPSPTPKSGDQRS